MPLGQIKCPPGSRRTEKRLGQGPGSGTGKTAGKGHKGQRSRSGAKRGRRTGFEGGQMPLYRRIPKIGFSSPFRKTFQVVNICDIDERDLEGVVGPEEMANVGLIRKLALPVKILGRGEIKRGLTIKAHKFSKAAQAAIEQAGGKVEVI
jgi:large subunit ribosomal protein L15